MAKNSKKTRNIIGIVLVVLIGLVIWSMAGAMSDRSKSKYKHLGIAEYEKGNYQKAIEYYNKGLEAKPDDPCLFNNRGLAYYSLEQYDKAIADFTKAIELRPDLVDAYYMRAVTFTEQIHYHHKYKTIPPKFPSEDDD